MRLFIALEPTREFREALAALQERIMYAGITARYYTPSNLHMTLAFIGQWPEDVSELLPRVAVPFSIALSHVGIFPEADVLYAGVKPSKELDALAGQVRRRLAEAGIPFDVKPFYPHITLARKPKLPERVDLDEITVPPAVMTVRDVCLYKSEHGENGMEYTVIGRSDYRVTE